MSAERLPRVVIGGWYGAANLGDEWILSVFIEWVRKGGGDPVVISVNPHYTRAVHRVDAVGYTDLPEIVEAMAGADLFVLGGGGLFQDYDAFDVPSLDRFPARNVSQFAQFFYLAGELRLPAAVLGQGVGPLRGADARAIAADVFGRATACSVRDVESAQLLHDIGIAKSVLVAPDPAWSWESIEPIVPRSRFAELANSRVLAVVVREWPFDRSWEMAFVPALRASLPSGWACLWLDFTRVPDATARRPVASEIADRLIPQLPGIAHVRWDGMRVEEAAGLVAGCDALVTMRLHGALLGHLARIPVVALEYDAKVRALGDELGVPAVQRMPLDAISDRLPAAIRCVTGSDARAPFRMDAAGSSQRARAALAHRELLWQSMRSAAHEGAMPKTSYLSRWVGQHDAAARARIASALRASESSLVGG